MDVLSEQNQNESKVGRDMLLVSDCGYFKNMCQQNFETRHIVSPYNIWIFYITNSLDLCNINNVYATSACF